MDDMFKTAVAVFIGGLAAIFAWEGIHLFALQVAAADASRQLQAEMRKMEDQNRANAAAIEAQAAARAQAQADADARTREQLAESQRQNAAAQANAAAYKAARDEAWKKFYQPTDACRATWTGDCADAFIKAKRAFQEIHGPG